MSSKLRRLVLVRAASVTNSYGMLRRGATRGLGVAGLGALTPAGLLMAGLLMAGLLMVVMAAGPERAQAQVSTPAKVWEATLTVEDGLQMGYQVFSQTAAYGDLTPNAGPFTWPGDASGQPLYIHTLYSYFSQELRFGFADRYHYSPDYPHDPTRPDAGVSRFPEPRPERFDAVLCLSGRAYPFDESDFTSPSRSRGDIDGLVLFDDPGLNWSRGDRAQVSLWAVANKQGNHAGLCSSQSAGLSPLSPLPTATITSNPHERIADADLPCQASGANRPMTNANGDFNVRYDRTALLDGTLTRNHQGNVDNSLSYRWYQISGPAALVLDPDSVSTDVRMPLFAAPGLPDRPRTELEFLLCATAPNGATASDSMIVSMVTHTPKPLAHTAKDQIVEPGSTVTLTGDGSYNPYAEMMGGNPQSPWKLDYLWEQISGPDVQLSDPTAANPTFTAPTGLGDMMMFRLTVSTRLGDKSISDSGGEFFVDRTWGYGNNAIVIVNFADAGPDRSVMAGEPIQLVSSGSRNPFSNPRSQHRLYSRWKMVWDSVRGPDGMEPVPTSPEDPYDDLYSDASYQSRYTTGDHSFYFTVPQGTPPGASVQFELLVYADWPGSGFRIYSSDTMTLTVAPQTSNSQVIGENNQVEEIVEVVAESNSAPVFDEGASATRKLDERSPADTEVGDPLSASDADGDSLTYALTGTDAGAFAIDEDSGQITTIAGQGYVYSEKPLYRVSVTADDGRGGVARIDVVVNIQDKNDPPRFVEGDSAARSLPENSPPGTKVGNLFLATDPEVNPLTYSISGTDAGSFTMDQYTGYLKTKSGVVYDYETKPTYELTVTATDPGGLSASIAVTVTLVDVAEAAQTPDPQPTVNAVTSCFTDLGSLGEAVEYAGSWDDADCQAHHAAARARYFQFTLAAETTVAVDLSAGNLYVSRDTPKNGWGKVPGPGYEHRLNVRRGNGKLVHDGSSSPTLTLAAGRYTVEVVGSGAFTLSITPQ